MGSHVYIQIQKNKKTLQEITIVLLKFLSNLWLSYTKVHFFVLWDFQFGFILCMYVLQEMKTIYIQVEMYSLRERW